MTTPQDMIPYSEVASKLTEFDSAPAALHNFDGEPDVIWKLTAYATGPSCKNGQEILGQTFPLKYWFIHAADLEAEDGELKTCARTVLIDPSGNAFGFVSEGVFDSLRLMVQTIGRGPYDPPKMIVVRQQQGKHGRRYFYLEPAPDRHHTKTEGE